MTIAAAIAELKTLLGDGLSTAKADLEIHGKSEVHFADAAPNAVAFPTSTEQVAEIVKICARNESPVVPWGTGTSLEGHSLAVRGGVTVDFSRMKKVIEVHPEDLTCRVQPGVTRRELEAELRTTGLMFSVDPGADAALGGMAATRASGTTAVRYGTMRDNVLGLEVVMADGRIIRTGTRARKSSAGYDLTALFVGSEGTLGLITELTLKLHGRPEAVMAAMTSFPSVAAAVDTVIATIQAGIPMARIELLDALSVQSFNFYAGTNYPEQPHLMLEFHGSEASVAENAQRFADVAADFRAGEFQIASREEDRRALWRMRHDGFYAHTALRPGAKGLATDICVPISRLAEAVAETQDDLAKAPFPGPILGHVGDGNFHATLLVDVDNPEEVAAAKEIGARLAERALRLGGTVTGEHGVGFGKMAYMAEEHGDAWGVMGEIKKALDPGNILNPGKVVRVN